MSSENINNTHKGKKILIAPLDWGLGHSTRLIPIIRYLITLGSIPIIACDDNAKAILKDEFPDLTYIFLPGYNIKYSKNGKWLVFKLLAQAPRVMKHLFVENEWLKKAVVDHNIDGIISDNRPSFFHKKLPSVYITHQLQIFSRFAFIRNFAKEIHYKYINKFQECWIPDFEGKENLAGFLSHPELHPLSPVKYIGPLSRFSSSDKEDGKNIVAILSGPEPQRSIFEDMLVRTLKEVDKSATIVVGKPTLKKLKFADGNLTVYNHLNQQELAALLKSARIIIARAGYSTIMDLMYLQKDAILIPTPGQSEQEYLATHLKDRNNFFFTTQNEKKIKEAISNFQNRAITEQEPLQPSFEQTVTDFVNNL